MPRKDPRGEVARKIPLCEVGRRQAESKRVLGLAEELDRGTLTHYCRDCRVIRAAYTNKAVYSEESENNTDPKPVYESQEVKAFRDVPVYVEHSFVKQNRVDALFIDIKRKEVIAVVMLCPWMDNQLTKTKEKTAEYGPLRLEMIQQYPGYTIKQHNIITDVLGGWSRGVDVSMIELFGGRGEGILRKMQKADLSNTLSI
ncbi:hypothetical protein AWC38_SpisGene3224 [Stylophora pistillata]|uniref:Uncharacterized protein n=1 Tax=Stylophora pistillata TaxID=50429 RepID=A0A2B4STX6_STYPI|nr:hypothetical protein AWC38_SpisGene3224 [Stylophora pistillata]